MEALVATVGLLRPDARWNASAGKRANERPKLAVLEATSAREGALEALGWRLADPEVYRDAPGARDRGRPRRGEGNRRRVVSRVGTLCGRDRSARHGTRYRGSGLSVAARTRRHRALRRPGRLRSRTRGGDRPRQIAERDALAHVAGVCIGQDISERRMQFADKPPQFPIALRAMGTPAGVGSARRLVSERSAAGGSYRRVRTVGRSARGSREARAGRSIDLSRPWSAAESLRRG